MTDEARSEAEIEAKLQDLDRQRAAIHEEMVALNQELTVARARAQLDAMTGPERDALIQAIQPAGVASKEAVQ